MFLGIPCAFFTSIVLCAKLATRNNNANLPPYFEAIKSEIVNHLNLTRSDKKLTKPSVYTLEDGFIEQDRYFMEDMREERMEIDSPVLYRPQIVEKLLHEVEVLFDRKGKKGLMVKGPQGVGKSYSLVNLAQHLLASDKYIVTFIPDCANFEEWSDLYRFILASVGVERRKLPIGKTKAGLGSLVDAIDDILQRKGKRWVFIFDQINKIFDKNGCESKKDIKSLPLPFSMIRNVMKPGRIISIVSASANNEASYRENHEGFVEWEHPHNLEMGEVNLLYPNQISRAKHQEASETGYVPMYLDRWVDAVKKKKVDSYFVDLDLEIGTSLSKLEEEYIGRGRKWQKIVHSGICCVQGIPFHSSPPLIDRKYSFLEADPKDLKKKYVRALFPYVKTRYMQFFWEDLLKYYDESESELLNVCKQPGTTDDVRGRIFESIVLRRLGRNGILLSELKQLLKTAGIEGVFGKLDDPGLQLVDGTTLVDGTKFPVLSDIRKGFLSVPLFPNFPAVDAILIVEEVAIVIQVHSAKHKDVSGKLLQCARKANWLDAKGVEAVLLVYVSPNSRTAKEMMRRVNKKRRKVELKATAANTQSDKIISLFCCLENFESLRTLPWPCQ